MNSYILESVLALLIVVPASIGAYRYRLILPPDRPFIWLLWIGTVNEVLMIVLAKTIQNNLVSMNIYMFFDAFLIAQTFYKWGCLYRRKWLFRVTRRGEFISRCWRPGC